MCMCRDFCNRQYCAITEQGDLGLGAELLNDRDQRILNEHDNRNVEQFSDNKKENSEDKK